MGRPSRLLAPLVAGLAVVLGGGCYPRDADEPVRPLRLSAPTLVVKAPARPARPSRAPSLALGTATAGRLRHGRLLPASGPGFVTWDPVLARRPNRAWRRWGTDRLVRVVQTVLADYRRAHPTAPPVLVGDLSRRHGGVFDRRFGGLGHRSHQNGLDVDLYYPRRDRRLREPRTPGQVDRRLAQDLVDRFVAAGAQLVFVGPRVRLRGPRRVVQPLVHHDDHLHVRLPPASASSPSRARPAASRPVPRTGAPAAPVSLPSPTPKCSPSSPSTAPRPRSGSCSAGARP
jgi:murein endopeptidase